MSEPIFEHHHRGNLWRLSVDTYKGRAYANWRKWYDSGHGWKPSREGMTMPLEGLADLAEALQEYLAQGGGSGAIPKG